MSEQIKAAKERSRQNSHFESDEDASLVESIEKFTGQMDAGLKFVAGAGSGINEYAGAYFAPPPPLFLLFLCRAPPMSAPSIPRSLAPYLWRGVALLHSFAVFEVHRKGTFISHVLAYRNTRFPQPFSTFSGLLLISESSQTLLSVR